MRKVGWVLALAMGWSWAAGAVEVPNGGFETGEPLPTGWSASQDEGGQGSVSVETAKVHGGQRALTIRKTNVAGYTLLRGPKVTVEPGKDYLVRGWLHVEGRSRASIYFMLSQFPGDDQPWDLPNVFGMGRSYNTGDGWVPLEATVGIRPKNTRLQIQVVVTKAPVVATLDDLEVVPAAAGASAYHPRYEPAEDEPLPPLEPAQARVAARPAATGKVEVRDGRPRFIIDGKPTPACFMVLPFHRPQKAQIADFRDAGVRVYLLPLMLGHGIYGEHGAWYGPGKYDFKEVDELLWRILRVDPDGYVIFYFGSDPYNDWGKDHPDDVAMDQDGKRAVVGMHPKDYGREPAAGERYGPSLVSETLRRDSLEAIRQLVRHVKASPAGRAVVGWHVAGFNDGQFFPWEQPGHVTDYSPAALRTYRAWLRTRYRDDVAALRAAWGQPAVTFDTAAFPAGTRVLRAGGLMDGRADADVADFNRFHSEGPIDTIVTYARAIREEMGRPVLTSTYYEDMPAGVTGHLALGYLLRSGAVDFLAGPTAYGVRSPGEVGECHSTWGSVGLHGRIYLTEQDFRSWRSGPVSQAYDHSVARPETAAEHNAIVRRESGMMLAYGQGTWWYDMDGGWFHDPGIMKGIAEARNAFASDLTTRGTPRADVAVFVDERSTDYLAWQSRGPWLFQSVINQLFTLNQSGVPYHLYLQEDLTRGDLPDHRMYLFLNAWHLSAAERAAVERLKREGKLLAFVGAAGTIGADNPVQAMAALTGLKVKAAPGPESRGVNPVAGMEQLLGGPVEVLNVGGLAEGYAVDDPAATPVGTFGEGGVAMAARDCGAYKVFYSALHGLSDELVNRLARWAGAWVAAEPGDAVYANQWFATVHALDDGDKTLRLASPSRVVDLTTGQEVAARAETVKLTLKRGETRWFALTPER